VADRVRVAASRKRGGAKRAAKKKSNRRQPGILLLVALMVLILGFLTRRIMLPSAVYYLAHRPPDQPRRSGEVESSAPTNDDAPNAGANRDENLSTGDKRQLNEIIKHKAK
jgi:hypothetical protein